MPLTEKRSRLLKRGAILLVALITACLVVRAGFFWWVDRPSYLELDVRFPGGKWSYVELAERTWEGGHRFFIVRYDGTVYGRDGFETKASVVDYFDTWLVEQGWDRGGNYLTCNRVLPETKGMDLYDDYRIYTLKLYRDPSHLDYYAARTVACLIVLPIPSDVVHGYDVVLATQNPSLREKIRTALD